MYIYPIVIKLNSLPETHTRVRMDKNTHNYVNTAIYFLTLAYFHLASLEHHRTQHLEHACDTQKCCLCVQPRLVSH